MFYKCLKGKARIAICKDFGDLKINELEKMLSVMTKYRNVCAHGDRLFDFHTRDALQDMKIHHLLQLPKVNGHYITGKNDLFSQVITLKLLLDESDFHLFITDFQSVYKNIPLNPYIIRKMGFLQRWENISKLEI